MSARKNVEARVPIPLGNCTCACHQWPGINHPDGPCCPAPPYAYHGGRKATAAHPMCACRIVNQILGNVDPTGCPMHGKAS